MNFNNKYYHGVENHTKNFYEELKKVEKILSDHAILSRSLQDSNIYSKISFNGNNYISLCHGIIGKYIEHSAYNLFVKNSISLIINENLPDVINLNLLKRNISSYNESELLYFSNDNNKVRYTDLVDEVQVEDLISSNYFDGIGLPVDYILKNERRKMFLVEYFYHLQEFLKENKYTFKIYDIDNQVPVDEEYILKKIK